MSDKTEKLKRDAERYRYIRDNFEWRRYNDGEESYSLVGIRFEYGKDFGCPPMLDDAIDSKISEKKGT